MPKSLTQLRKEPGKSNAHKYKGVAKSNFAGPDETFPINTPKRARAALSYAHKAKDPSSIRSKVHKKYPSIGKYKGKSK